MKHPLVVAEYVRAPALPQVPAALLDSALLVPLDVSQRFQPHINPGSRYLYGSCPFRPYHIACSARPLFLCPNCSCASFHQLVGGKLAKACMNDSEALALPNVGHSECLVSSVWPMAGPSYSGHASSPPSPSLLHLSHRKAPVMWHISSPLAPQA